MLTIVVFWSLENIPTSSIPHTFSGSSDFTYPSIYSFDHNLDISNYEGSVSSSFLQTNTNSLTTYSSIPDVDISNHHTLDYLSFNLGNHHSGSTHLSTPTPFHYSSNSAYRKSISNAITDHTHTSGTSNSSTPSEPTVQVISRTPSLI